ncbi:hypothetical protein U1Q18_044653, partial [Sarracenia purpurea var. burkii]
MAQILVAAVDRGDGDAIKRSTSSRIRNREGGSVSGDDWRREGGFSRSGNGAVEEDEGAGGVGAIPEAE